MNFGTERNISYRQCISRQDICLFTAQDRRADFQTDRGDNVTLLTIEIRYKRNMGRAVRIVFDLRYFTGYAGFISSKIDDPVKPFVAAASTTDRNTAVAVTS